MMLPAAAPMIVIFAAAQARRSRGGAVPTWVFTLGYLLVWLAARVLAYVVVEIADQIAGHLAPENRAAARRLALDATLVMAGLYQFTALKRACLRRWGRPPTHQGGLGGDPTRDPHGGHGEKAWDENLRQTAGSQREKRMVDRADSYDQAGDAASWSALAARMKSFSCRPLIFLV
jgi:Predicted metal-binding integral membrane protein (DUF2182)